jgi:hypothetical protein
MEVDFGAGGGIRTLNGVEVASAAVSVEMQSLIRSMQLLSLF